MLPHLSCPSLTPLVRLPAPSPLCPSTLISLSLGSLLTSHTSSSISFFRLLFIIPIPPSHFSFLPLGRLYSPFLHLFSFIPLSPCIPFRLHSIFLPPTPFTSSHFSPLPALTPLPSSFVSYALYFLLSSAFHSTLYYSRQPHLLLQFLLLIWPPTALTFPPFQLFFILFTFSSPPPLLLYSNSLPSFLFASPILSSKFSTPSSHVSFSFGFLFPLHLLSSASPSSIHLSNQPILLHQFPLLNPAPTAFPSHSSLLLLSSFAISSPFPFPFQLYFSPFIPPFTYSTPSSHFPPPILPSPSFMSARYS